MVEMEKVEAVFLQPEDREAAVGECVVIAVVGGPKAFFRFWPGVMRGEWGWTLHPSAVEVWRRSEDE